MLPIGWILSLSFKGGDDITNKQFLPTKWSLENFRTVFSNDLFTTALRNSIGVALISTLIGVIFAMFAAYGIARLEFPGELLAGELQPGDAVRREHGEDDADQRREERHPDGVAQRGSEQVVGEDRAEVLQAPFRRQELLVGDVVAALERQRQDPPDRQHRVGDDDDGADYPTDAVSGRRAAHLSPLTWLRSVLKPLTKMTAISTTVRNNSTDTAEPMPSATRVMLCR